jgi:hypothetical protein
MQTVQFANNESEPTPNSNNDGLLIHIDNGNIVAESVGIPDLPTEGRRMVVPAPSQGDIHEPSTPPKSEQPKMPNGSSPLAKTVSQQAADDEAEEEEGDEHEGEETDRLIK